MYTIYFKNCQKLATKHIVFNSVSAEKITFSPVSKAFTDSTLLS